MRNVPITPDWLAGLPAAVALLPRGIDDPSARRDAVHRAAARRIHPTALEALARRASSPTREAHLEALARGGAACVVTGQQPGLFGGPMYSLYKAAAAIVDARALAAETGVPCVPVFWLQSEDHQWDAIDACSVLDRGGALTTARCPGREEDAGRSIGARQLGPQVGPALDALEAALEGLSEAAPVMALLRESYRPEATPDAAFAAWVDALFAAHGLLVLDPRDPALAAAAHPLHLRALDATRSIDAALRARADALRAEGYRVQVHLREGAPLSFFHPDGPDGPRFRLEPAGPDALRLRGTERTVTRDELRAAPPDRFGTSALLRPLLQDTLLPTAAYVGGPGEIAYLAQLPPVYDVLDVQMPLIVPRARFRVVDETATRLLEQLGLALDDLDRDRPELLAAVGRAGSKWPPPDDLEAALLGPMEDTLEALREPAEALDRGLEKAVEKTRASMADLARRLVDRYRRTLARRDGVTEERLDRLLARLAPNGAPQERVLCWPWFGARYGVAGFVDAVLAEARPFDGSLRTLRP